MVRKEGERESMLTINKKNDTPSVSQKNGILVFFLLYKECHFRTLVRFILTFSLILIAKCIDVLNEFIYLKSITIKYTLTLFSFCHVRK